jgi:uncharacterized protein
MTKRYIEVARQGKNDWWRYIFGWIIPPVIMYVVAIVGYVWPTTNTTGVIHISGKEFWNLVPTPVGMIFVMLIIVGGGLGVFFVTTKIHKRPFLSLVSADETFHVKRLFQAMGLWLLLRFGRSAFWYSQNPEGWKLVLDFTKWLEFFPLTLLFCVTVTSAMLLYLIAYPLQMISLFIRRLIPLGVFSGICAAAINLFRLSRYPSLSPLETTISTILWSLGILTWVVIILKDNRLELVAGIYAASFFYETAIVRMVANRPNGFYDSIPSIWKVQPIENLFIGHPQLYVLNILFGFTMLGIFYYVFLRKPDRQQT